MQRLTAYDCLWCERSFQIALSDTEAAAGLNPDRTEECPQCSRRIGSGPALCKKCGQSFELLFPHWHVRCDLANGVCPACANRYVSLCIC